MQRAVGPGARLAVPGGGAEGVGDALPVGGVQPVEMDGVGELVDGGRVAVGVGGHAGADGGALAEQVLLGDGGGARADPADAVPGAAVAGDGAVQEAEGVQGGQGLGSGDDHDAGAALEQPGRDLGVAQHPGDPGTCGGAGGDGLSDPGGHLRHEVGRDRGELLRAGGGAQGIHERGVGRQTLAVGGRQKGQGGVAVGGGQAGQPGGERTHRVRGHLGCGAQCVGEAGQFGSQAGQVAVGDAELAPGPLMAGEGVGVQGGGVEYFAEPDGEGRGAPAGRAAR